MELTKSNTLILPTGRFEAPTCWDKERLWFDKEPYKWEFDMDCESALIANGIGEHECPTDGDWAAFSIAGAVVAALTGKYIVPDALGLFSSREDKERYVWEALWQAVQENETKLDRAFSAAMMRSFIPRNHYAPPERPYTMSHFVSHWRGREYADSMFRSISNIRIGILKQGSVAINRLPQTTADSIKEAAQHVPMMLEIAIDSLQDA